MNTYEQNLLMGCHQVLHTICILFVTRKSLYVKRNHSFSQKVE